MISLKEALPYYPNLKPEMIRVVLVHPGEFVLPKLGEELGRYASRKLAERGIEIRPNTKIKAVTSNGVELTDGARYHHPYTRLDGRYFPSSFA